MGADIAIGLCRVGKVTRAMDQFCDDASRDEVRALMATHRYGIHGMREEHFGMAPAELARAGCIVWVPRGGGQMEIVGAGAGVDVRLGRRCG